MDEAKRKALRTRLTIGPVLIGFIVAVYWFDARWGGGFASAALLGLISVAGVLEYVVMMRGANHPVAGWMVLAAAATLHASAFFFGWKQLDGELYPLLIVTAALLFALSLRALTREHMPQGLEELGSSLLGLILLAWPFYLAQGLAIRSLDALFFLVLVAKCCDMGAYFTGIAIGKHKLIPHVSPGKTVEGAIGGIAGSVLAALLLRRPLLGPELPLTLTGLILVAIMIGVTTQVGDLVESLMKRRCNVKDSSRLLPQHGGVLDLVDSFLFSVPAFFLVVVRLT